MSEKNIYCFKIYTKFMQFVINIVTKIMKVL